MGIEDETYMGMIKMNEIEGDTLMHVIIDTKRLILRELTRKHSSLLEIVVLQCRIFMIKYYLKLDTILIKVFGVKDMPQKQLMHV